MWTHIHIVVNSEGHDAGKHRGCRITSAKPMHGPEVHDPGNNCYFSSVKPCGRLQDTHPKRVSSRGSAKEDGSPQQEPDQGKSDNKSTNTS
jgi:hypothetical protein